MICFCCKGSTDTRVWKRGGKEGPALNEYVRLVVTQCIFTVLDIICCVVDGNPATNSELLDLHADLG